MLRFDQKHIGLLWGYRNVGRGRVGEPYHHPESDIGLLACVRPFSGCATGSLWVPHASSAGWALSEPHCTTIGRMVSGLWVANNCSLVPLHHRGGLFEEGIKVDSLVTGLEGCGGVIYLCGEFLVCRCGLLGVVLSLFWCCC
ncbi:MAG: hypothetical protein QXH56_08435, partial [Thermoprotei archaeon]